MLWPWLAVRRMVYNAVVVPSANRLVWNALKRVVQGNDAPVGQVVDVGSVPTDAPPEDLPQLPQSVLAELRTAADDLLRERVPELRESLLQLKLGDVRLGEVDLASGLIHTGYFDNQFVRDLISERIKKVMGISLGSERAQLGEWLDEWDSSVRRWLDSLAISVE